MFARDKMIIRDYRGSKSLNMTCPERTERNLVLYSPTQTHKPTTRAKENVTLELSVQEIVADLKKD